MQPILSLQSRNDSLSLTWSFLLWDLIFYSKWQPDDDFFFFCMKADVAC